MNINSSPAVFSGVCMCILNQFFFNSKERPSKRLSKTLRSVVFHHVIGIAIFFS